jgi:hypothetical protein
VPERLQPGLFGYAVDTVELQERSQLAPSPDIARQRPSNLWGVGYRLLADYEEARRTA